MAAEDAAVASRLLALLDLTNLDDICGSADISALCARATRGPVPVAAVCLWPRFVGEARQLLAQSEVRVATVSNFPAGGDDLDLVLAEVEQALRDGAHEIDLVLPWRAYLRGDEAAARAMVARTKALLPADRSLKVILETGALPDAGAIAGAARLAIAAGADFLKTSTGKLPVSATPQAARIVLEEIAAADRPVGFKAAGGIRTLADAAGYLALADEIMGPTWAGPATFRIGASSLHATLVAAIDGGSTANPGTGY
jgi:deoxyribose-phosphate aldolase